MRLALGLVLACASAAAFVVGYLGQHRALTGAASLTLGHPLAGLKQLFTNKVWLVAYGAGIAGWGSYIAALALAPLSLVQAVTGATFGPIALVSMRDGGRRRRRASSGPRPSPRSSDCSSSLSHPITVATPTIRRAGSSRRHSSRGSSWGSRSPGRPRSRTAVARGPARDWIGHRLRRGRRRDQIGGPRRSRGHPCRACRDRASGSSPCRLRVPADLAARQRGPLPRSSRTRSRLPSVSSCSASAPSGAGGRVRDRRLRPRRRGIGRARGA